jgi:hypothetical protein
MSLYFIIGIQQGLINGIDGQHASTGISLWQRFTSYFSRVEPRWSAFPILQCNLMIKYQVRSRKFILFLHKAVNTRTRIKAKHPHHVHQISCSKRWNIKPLCPTNNPNLVRTITRHKQSSLIVKSHISRTEAFIGTIRVVRVAHDVDSGLVRSRWLSRHTRCGIDDDLAETVAIWWATVPAEVSVILQREVWKKYVPGAVETNVCCCAVWVKAYAQGCCMRRKA